MCRIGAMSVKSDIIEKSVGAVVDSIVPMQIVLIVFGPNSHSNMGNRGVCP